MPAAKKPATRRATRNRASSAAPKAITRKDVEKATAQFEKALDQASTALQTLGQDFGKGAVTAYKDVEKALRALRRDAAKTNKLLLKDLDNLMSAMTPSAVSSRTTGRSTAKKAPARKSAARKPAARKPAASKSGSGTRARTARPAARRTS